MSPITAIAPWFGGKRTLAPLIVRELGDHAAYFEPFCGSCAVLLAKGPSGHETVNDLHGDLINLARVLASASCSDLYGRLARTLHVEGIFEEAKERTGESGDWAPSTLEVTGAHMQRAVDFFVLSWSGRNGVSGTARTNHTFAVRYTPGGGAGGQRFRSAVDAIPAWHERLRNVTILRRCGLDLLESIDDDPRTAVYVDPPYFKSTRGKGGGSLYEHDFEDAEHQRLAALCNRFDRARVVVSYYDDDRPAALYPAPKWTKIDCARSKNLAQQNRRGSNKRTLAPEVLLLNGPSYSAEGSLFG